MTTATPLRFSAECTRCGSVLLCPEWSESVDAQTTVNIWHCAVCDHEFETTGKCGQKTPSDAELVRAFFPSLLVA